MLSLDGIESLRKVEGEGRNVLTARINLLCKELREAIAQLDWLTKRNDEANANLTAVQERSTTLIGQVRKLKELLGLIQASSGEQRQKAIEEALTAAATMG